MKKLFLRLLLVLAPVIVFTSCDDRGKEKNFNGVQLFYTSEIRESQADSLGKFLIDNGFADGQTKTVQITKTEKTYEFRMVVKKGIEQDQEYCDMAKEMGALLSVTLFGEAQVDVHFCDENLKTLKVILMADISAYKETENNAMSSISNGIYDFRYSTDWTSDDSGKGGTEFFVSSPKEDDQDMFQENINLVIQDLSGQNMDLDAYTKLSESQIGSLLNDGVIKESQRIKKANYDCHKLVYTATQGEYQLYFEQYYWVLNEKVYVLTYTAEQSSYDKYKSVVESMLNSFSLNL